MNENREQLVLKLLVLYSAMEKEVCRVDSLNILRIQ